MSRIDHRHRMRRPGLSKKIALMGSFAAIAIVLSIVENLLTGMFNFSIPGLKPGLANLAVVLALYYLGGGYALVIALIKAAASFLATGAVTVFAFSLAGSVASVLCMWLLWKLGWEVFSLAGISAAGGAVSNFAQLACMILLSQTAEFWYYLPALILFGTGFGLLIGLICNLIVERVDVRMVLGRI